MRRDRPVAEYQPGAGALARVGQPVEQVAAQSLGTEHNDGLVPQSLRLAERRSHRSSEESAKGGAVGRCRV